MRCVSASRHKLHKSLMYKVKIKKSVGNAKDMSPLSLRGGVDEGMGRFVDD